MADEPDAVDHLHKTNTEQRQRSLSLPSFDGSSAWFPSPSSAFRTPPSNEAEILKDLISRERVKRDQKLSKCRSASALQAHKRATSASAVTSLNTVPDSSSKEHDQEAADSGSGSTTPPLSPSSDKTPIPTPTASVIALHGMTSMSDQPGASTSPSSSLTSQTITEGGVPASSETAAVTTTTTTTTTTAAAAIATAVPDVSANIAPGRPSSSYEPYLPDLDQPKTDTARRLSLSASRRNSQQSVQSSSSIPFGGSTEAETACTEGQTEAMLYVQEVKHREVTDLPITVRDYGFPEDDPRHIGQPLPYVATGTSSMSASSACSENSSRFRVGGMKLPEGVFDDSSSESGTGSQQHQQHHGGGGFSWDFVPPHQFDASAGSSYASSSGVMLSPTGDVPFVSPKDSDFGDVESDDDIQDNLTERGADDNVAGLDEIPEGGALYVAAYPFVPEAPQEMSLHVGEVVRVLERLCEGWVICVRQQPADAQQQKEGEDEHKGAEAGWVDAVETGLTPETYLQRFDLLGSQAQMLSLGQQQEQDQEERQQQQQQHQGLSTSPK